MDKAKLTEDLTRLFRACEGNTVSDETALEGCADLVMFEEPVFGFSSADDEIYRVYKRKDVIGDNYMLPGEWLPGARTVISFFLPFTGRVRRSNRCEPENTSSEWLHARIEGQAFLNAYSKSLLEYFTDLGMEACVPAIDKRFSLVRTAVTADGIDDLHFESSWSERHAAYASGLGTFCLSRGLISEKGVAGRYGSVIVSGSMEPDQRPYAGVYDYCIMCGACIERCPVGAISLRYGKNHLKCKQWMDVTGKRYDPRYGCGKCQTGVPCEDRIPGRYERAK